MDRLLMNRLWNADRRIASFYAEMDCGVIGMPDRDP